MTTRSNEGDPTTPPAEPRLRGIDEQAARFYVGGAVPAPLPPREPTVAARVTEEARGQVEDLNLPETVE